MRIMVTLHCDNLGGRAASLEGQKYMQISNASVLGCRLIALSSLSKPPGQLRSTMGFHQRNKTKEYGTDANSQLSFGGILIGVENALLNYLHWLRAMGQLVPEAILQHALLQFFLCGNQ